MFGNLVIGTGVLLPAGMLAAFIADFGVTPATAGLLMFVGGLVVGIGEPVLAGLTTTLDRRLLLTLSLVIYAVGHIGATLTTNFNVVIALRALTVIGAAIFTPQAAATIGLLAPAEKRGGAIAFIFIGWSLAAVIGIPLGSVLGDLVGWRPTFLMMAALSLFGALMVWLVLPAALFVQRIDLRAWVRVLTDVRLLIVLFVTMFAMAGQFTLFTYISPTLTLAYGASTNQIALIFLMQGVMGVIGNTVASRTAGRISVDIVVGIALVITGTGLALIGLGWGGYVAFLIGAGLWGLGGFAANSLQQSRLVTLAPALASATIALNTSFVYLGQSLGSASGGALISNGPVAAMAGAAAGLVFVGLALSLLASALHRRVALR